MARELVHGTAVALGNNAALLRGSSGAGKSDLALRFLAIPAEDGRIPRLVADDQVWVTARGNGELNASPPETLAGKIEVRGLGILQIPFISEARLVLACDLVAADQVPRMPPEAWEQTTVAGVAVPVIKLSPFEPSAPLKLKMALLLAAPSDPN